MENRDELTQAFATAVSVAIREMASVEAALADSRPEKCAIQPGEIAATLRLTGRDEGFLVLTMPTETATALARLVLAGTLNDPDEAMVQDCVNEVANIIAGQAKTLLYGTPHHFSFSPPLAAASPLPSEIEWMVQTFASDVGELTLHVHLP